MQAAVWTLKSPQWSSSRRHERSSMTAKQIRFVEAPLNPAQHVAEIAMFDGDGAPVKPFVQPGNATTAKPGLVKQAAHVDETTGTVADIVTALVTAGIMASA